MRPSSRHQTSFGACPGASPLAGNTLCIYMIVFLSARTLHYAAAEGSKRRRGPWSVPSVDFFSPSTSHQRRIKAQGKVISILFPHDRCSFSKTIVAYHVRFVQLGPGSGRKRHEAPFTLVIDCNTQFDRSKRGAWWFSNLSDVKVLHGASYTHLVKRILVKEAEWGNQ